MRPPLLPLSLAAPLLTSALAYATGNETAVVSNDEAPNAASREAPARLVPPVLHALALMTVMRATEAYLWPNPFAETKPSELGWHYHEAFSRAPLWDTRRPWYEADGDRWQINIVGHGVFGSELYLRARTCHEPAWQALLFAGLASATWEYGFEGNGVRPSGLDLSFTPLAGLVLGEARFQGVVAARSLASKPLRTAVTLLLDPLGEIERSLGSPC